MSEPGPDHYETLGLAPGASPELLKRAYLALVKRWHPDRFANDPAQQKLAEEKLRSINVAYEALQGEAQVKDSFQHHSTAPAYDSAGAANREGRSTYAFRERPSAFAFWRGHTGALSWCGSLLLAGIAAASVWFAAATLADYFGPPFLADSLRHEAKQQSVIARTRRAAEAGEPWAMFNMGWFHYSGRGVRVNHAEAAQWFSRGAQAGDAKSQTQLGLLHAKGEGVAQDYTAAASWFRAAAEQGQPDAQHNLALLHRSGLGVPVDFAEAFQWWSLAAAAGHATAGGFRDALLNTMTEQQVAEGRRRLQATQVRLPPRKQ